MLSAPSCSKFSTSWLPMLDSRPIRLLHVTRSETVGIRTFLIALLTNTDRSRFHVRVVTPHRGPLTQDAKALGIPVDVCPLERDIRPFSDLSSLRRMLTLLRKWRPDIVHLHGAKAGFLGRMAALMLNIPAVYTPNNDYLDEPMSSTKRRLLVAAERLIARSGMKIVSVSEEE